MTIDDIDAEIEAWVIAKWNGVPLQSRSLLYGQRVGHSKIPPDEFVGYWFPVKYRMKIEELLKDFS